MKFIADDGKIFDTMEKCEEYEKMGNEGKKIAELWQKYVTTYNKHGEETESVCLADEDISLFLEETSELLDTDESSYIKIDCDDDCDWDTICKFFHKEYGTILPKKKGFWRYDYEWGKWVNFEEEYKNFKDKWAPMGIF